jgi:hypothetical protein
MFLAAATRPARLLRIRGGVRQIVAVDRGVEDGAEQAQIGIDGRWPQVVGEQLGLPGADPVGIQRREAEVAEGWQDPLLDALANVVGGVWMLGTPGPVLDIGDVAAE